MTQPQSHSHLAAGFLEILFDECPGLIEFRLIEERKDGDCIVRFFPSPMAVQAALPAMQEQAYREGRAVFFGVLPRSRKGGKKADIGHGWAAWVDIDYKDTPEAEALDRLATVPTPSIVVASGHGLHAYWLMKEATAPLELEALSRRLAGALRADHCHDCTRILRLPGSLNLKEGWRDGVYAAPVAAPLVLMPTCDPSRRYIVDDFEFLPEPTATASPALSLPRGEVLTRPPLVVERLLKKHEWLRNLYAGKFPADNSRSDLAYAGALTRCGIIDPAALDAATRARPYQPHDGKTERTERDIQRVVDRALADYRAPAAPITSATDRDRDDDPGPSDDGTTELDGGDSRSPTPATLIDRSRERTTDLGNAHVLCRMYGDDIRWCNAMPGDGWMLWDGGRWATDETLAIRRHTDAVGEHWRQQAPPEIECPATEEDKEQNKRRKAILAWAAKTDSAAGVRAMVEMTRARQGIATRSTEWNADPWRFNTPGETYDLKRQVRYAPRREDHITRSASVQADALADCPTWTAFLWRIMGGTSAPLPLADAILAQGVAALGGPATAAAHTLALANRSAAEMVAFLQRAAGYALTGDTSEQCLFIAYGTGGNGKGVFLNTLQAILGEYAQTTQVATFLDRKAGGIPNDLAALAGARFVLCSEPDEGAKLAEGLIKTVTGQDVIAARFLNREFFNFIPQFKLWMMTNHKPRIDGTDDGMWRRLRLVPFTVTIPPAERDGKLPEKLRAEYPAILRWMLEGLKEWRRIGLSPPPAVTDASNEYRKEMDSLVDFLADRCTLGTHLSANNADVYASYKEWAVDFGLRPRSHKWLSQQLTARGLAPARTGSIRSVAGIELKVKARNPPDMFGQRDD